MAMSAPTQHLKADPVARSTDATGKAVIKPIDLWLQDETRLGQQGILKRI